MNCKDIYPLIYTIKRNKSISCFVLAYKLIIRGGLYHGKDHTDSGQRSVGRFCAGLCPFQRRHSLWENWNNQDIDVKTRCMITVVALMSSGITDSSLTSEDAKAAHAASMLFPIGAPNNGFAQYFTGQSYLAPVSGGQVGIFNVTLEPGRRNNWHIHHADKGGGQILICVGGRGYYQEWARTPSR